MFDLTKLLPLRGALKLGPIMLLEFTILDIDEANDADSDTVLSGFGFQREDEDPEED